MQRMRTVIPPVEAANDRHFARIRRPHAEKCALRLANGCKVAAQLFVGAVIAALIEKIKILLGQKANLRARTRVQRWIGFRHGRGWTIPDSVPDLLSSGTMVTSLCVQCEARVLRIHKADPLEGRVLDFLARHLAFR